jgi:hypothetical protein
MGSFYTSHIVRGPSQSQVLAWLKERPAYVSVTQGGTTVVLDAACESQDGEELAELAAGLSAQFKCPVLALLNHDDDILYYELHESGKKTDEYNSSPGFFGEGESEAGPSGGDAARLAKAFGVTDSAPIEAALRNPGYVFAMERHRDLAAALGLPEFSVGLGYTYAEAGEFPPGTPPDAYTHSGAREG